MRDKFTLWTSMLVARPFKVMATVNALASLLVGILYIAGPKSPVSGGRLYGYLSSGEALNIWCALMLISSVTVLLGVHYKDRVVAGWSSSGLSVAWIYAVMLSASYGNFIFSVPFLMFPFLLSIYVKLKISLDTEWSNH